jgi:hypothetical protein
MVKTSLYQKKKRNSKKRFGGSNASDWTKQVVGEYPHVAQVGTNVITNNVPIINTPSLTGGNVLNPASVVDAAPLVAPMVSVPITSVGTGPIVRGGKSKRSNKRKGGDLVTELAVPAILLVANQTIGKKTGKKYAFSKKRFSKRRNTRFNRRR